MAAGPAQGADAQPSRTEILVNAALSGVQGFVQGHVERKIEEKLAMPMKLINALAPRQPSGAAAAPVAGSAPAWYTAASAPMPEVSDAERAIAEAKRIADAESNMQLGNMYLSHMQRMSSITRGGS